MSEDQDRTVEMSNQLKAKSDEIAKLRAQAEDHAEHRDSLIVRLKAAELQVRKLQEILAAALESGEINVHDEDPKCPQDDTCACIWAKKVSAAMKGYDEVGLLQVPAPLTVDSVLGAGYGEVCPKCGLLIRITCRC